MAVSVSRYFSISWPSGPEKSTSRQRHQAAGAEELDDFRHPRIDADEQVTGDGNRGGRRTHHPLVDLSGHLRRAQQGLRDLEVLDQLRQQRLRLGEAL